MNAPPLFIFMMYDALPPGRVENRYCSFDDLYVPVINRSISWMILRFSTGVSVHGISITSISLLRDPCMTALYPSSLDFS